MSIRAVSASSGCWKEKKSLKNKQFLNLFKNFSKKTCNFPLFRSVWLKGKNSGKVLSHGKEISRMLHR